MIWKSFVLYYNAGTGKSKPETGKNGKKTVFSLKIQLFSPVHQSVFREKVPVVKNDQKVVAIKRIGVGRLVEI